MPRLSKDTHINFSPEMYEDIQEWGNLHDLDFSEAVRTLLRNALQMEQLKNPQAYLAAYRQVRQEQEKMRQKHAYQLEVYTGSLTSEERSALLEEGFATTEEPDTFITKRIYSFHERAQLEALDEKLHQEFPGVVTKKKFWYRD